MENRTQKLFSMRTDSDEGRDFLAAVDELRKAEMPRLDRTAMVKKLAFEARRKMKSKEGKA